MLSQIYFQEVQINIEADLYLDRKFIEILADPEAEALDKAATKGALTIFLDSCLSELALKTYVAEKIGEFLRIFLEKQPNYVFDCLADYCDITPELQKLEDYPERLNQALDRSLETDIQSINFEFS